MGEKLNAFISFYSLKATEEVEKWKTKTIEDDVKWKKLTDELYPAALKTATDLKQVETFQQVFPTPGTYIENVTKYGSLLGTDPDFAKQLNELYKWRNTKTQIANRTKYFLKAVGYVSKGGEDYLNRLVKEISSKLVGTTLAVALFKSYPDYVEYIEDLIDDVPGPGGVLTTPETYAALLEKRDAGAFPAGAGSVSDTGVTGAKPPTETSSSSTLNESTQSAKPTDSANAGSVPSSSINSSTNKKESSSPETKSPINTTSPSKSETISTTSLEGGVTSKPGEIVEETKVPVNETKPAINININQAAQVIPPTTEKSTSTLNTPSEATSSPKGIPTPIGSVTVPPTVSTTSTINSSEKILVPEKSVSTPPQVTPVQNIQQPAQLVTPEKSVSTTVLNTPVSSTTSSLSVENTSNISNSAPNVKSENKKILDVSNKKMVNNTVNNTDNKTSEFFSKLGKAAKSVGSALNLPTTAELKSQASGLFGATGENIKSKVSDLTKAFSNSSINNTSNPSTVNSKSEASSSNLATSTNTNAVSNNEILANKSTSNVSVEQGKPTVLARSETTNTTSQTENINSNSPTSISNNGSSQNTTVTAQPGQTEVSQTSQETQIQQPAQNSGGSIIDMSELTRSISRLERILISGLEVTIKDT